MCSSERERGVCWEKRMERETSRSISMSIRTVIPQGINRIASCNLKYGRNEVTWDSYVVTAVSTGQKRTYWAPFQ
jgi:hypothetical protein